VYAAISINPYPANYCDKCSAPIDPAYVSTITAPDGTFTLPLDNVPVMPTIDFAIQIGRFRKHTNLAVTPCTTTAVPMAAETLPGNSTVGDIPKIAVSTGNVDHLDQVLNALGITQYDCYEGRASTSPAMPWTYSKAPTCATTGQIVDVISNPTTLANYHMAFLSCAPDAYGNFTTPLGQKFVGTLGTYPGRGYSTSTMSTNTQNWVASGGRLFVTDTAYDYIAQAFPAPITWAGPGGSPQPVDGANIGCAPGASPHTVLYPTTINDPTLAAWLKLPAIGFPNSPNVETLGFYQPWSMMQSLAPATELIATGTSMPIDPTYNATKCATPTMSPNVPLTAQFDVPSCGRVIFSSYHTASGNNATSANEKIMEFLIFAAAVCHSG
jgi:hypothetical protein